MVGRAEWSNEEMNSLTGVNTGMVKMINFALVGDLTGLSAFLNVARYLTVGPSMGQGFQLEAIAACVVGGNALGGGFGSIMGTFLGSVILAEMSSGLILMGALTSGT